ncbi:MAG: hypothetical protein MZV65_29205 [Chromatiales bacterium]|nr:hypothetical protein [Chromatiales bacterium]
MPGWRPDGDIQRYAGEDLFVYIDGGAEIYHEYGFRRVVARDYRNAAGKSVTLGDLRDDRPACRVWRLQLQGQRPRAPHSRRAGGRPRGLLPEHLEGSLPGHGDRVRRKLRSAWPECGPWERRRPP